MWSPDAAKKKRRGKTLVPGLRLATLAAAAGCGMLMWRRRLSAGMGSGGGTLQQCVQLASREAVARNWRRCKHLVIDEVSMIDADFFDKLEAVARLVGGWGVGEWGGGQPSGWAVICF